MNRSKSVNYNKYQKYKNKYLKLLNQIGGIDPIYHIDKWSELSEEMVSVVYNGNEEININQNNHLKKLTFGYFFTNGNHPLLPNSLPDSLEEVHFGELFSNGGKPLVPGVLPLGLKSFRFGNSLSNGNKPLEPNILPNGLKHLDFGQTFNNGSQELFENVLPSSLEFLNFGGRFNNGNKSLKSDVLPTSLKSIDFGNSFNNGNQPLQSGILPITLESLKFGSSFNNGNQALMLGVLPDSLKSIDFGNLFNNGNQPLQIGILPNSLKSIKFGNYFKNGDQPLKFGVLPNSLESIDFGNNFNNGNRPIEFGVLPTNLESLICSLTNGNQPLKPGILPSGLVYLDWSRSSFANGNQPLATGIFPDNIKTIKFGDRFTNGNRPLNGNEFPDYVECLYIPGINNGGKKLRYNTLPPNLTTLTISLELVKKHYPNVYADLSNIPADWFFRYRKSTEPQLIDAIELNSDSYIDHFRLVGNVDQSIIIDLIEANQFEVVGLHDLSEVIKTLTKILTIDNPSNQDRKIQVLKYFRLVPNSVNIGLFPNDHTIFNHLDYWRKHQLKYGHLFKLPTVLEKLEPDSREYLWIVKLFEDSWHPIDANYLKLFYVSTVFRVDIPIQNYEWSNRLNKNQPIPVWHGTKQENLLSILRTGFTPINTPEYTITPSVTGKMFGDGIYLTDHSSKAAYYSNKLREQCIEFHNSRIIKDKSYSGWLFLCDLDTGKIYNAKRSDINPKFTIPDGYDSLFADPKTLLSIDRSERVIYNSNRVLCRYLVQINCVNKA